jgi:hypothetical protein
LARTTDIPFADNSQDDQFQFTFTCPVCQKAYVSAPVRSAWYQEYGPTNRLKNKIAVLGDLLATQKANGEKRSHATLNPTWRRERIDAFAAAEREMASAHFMRCAVCGHDVCTGCADDGLCPRCR